MRLGPDAYEDLPTSRRLAERLAGRTAPIKPLLLDAFSRYAFALSISAMVACKQ